MIKLLSNYFSYSFKVLIGTVILLIVTVVTTRQVFKEKLKLKSLDAED